jgi:hypothetical protein
MKELEYWSNGVMGSPKFTLRVTHFSITPLFYLIFNPSLH